MKPATAFRKYDTKDWIQKDGWIFDRAKYLLSLQQNDYNLFTDRYYQFSVELAKIEVLHRKIYSMAWFDFFQEGAEYIDRY